MKKVVSFRSVMLSFWFCASIIGHAEHAVWSEGVMDSSDNYIDLNFFKEKFFTPVYFVDESFDGSDNSFRQLAKGMARTVPAVESIFVVRSSNIGSQDDFRYWIEKNSADTIKNISVFLKVLAGKEKKELEILEKKLKDEKKIDLPLTKEENVLVELGVKNLKESIHYIWDQDEKLSKHFGIGKLGDIPYALLIIDNQGRVVSRSGKEEQK